MHSELLPDAGTLEVRCRITKVSTAGDMIVEGFDFEVRQNNTPIFNGNTVFGFFTDLALSQQKGIQQAAGDIYQPTQAELDRARAYDLKSAAPRDPHDPARDPAAALALPAKALLMIDRIDAYVPDGGPAKLGFIRGTKQVDPAEWFFKAHFYQDPVCPGSLGIESFLQLIKFAALRRWPDRVDTHRFAPVLEIPHQYQYRGQILPNNKTVTVEAVITSVKETRQPVIMADGRLSVDGLTIYKMKNFGLQLVEI
jgi:3-hydroxymyristoyl/3-hydroxydecanoyl-(acyl carrier protein) dehydratase